MNVWLELGGIVLFMLFMGIFIGINVGGLMVQCGDCQLEIRQTTWCNSSFCDRKFDISVGGVNVTHVCDCPNVIVSNLDTK